MDPKILQEMRRQIVYVLNDGLTVTNLAFRVRAEEAEKLQQPQQVKKTDLYIERWYASL